MIFVVVVVWAPHALKHILYNIGDLTPVPVVCKPDLVKGFGRVRSDYFQTHLLHSDMHDCFETSSDRTVCIKRICKVAVPSSPSIIHSCVVHQEKYVEIVFNKTSDYKYKSSPIYISCDEGKKTKLYPEHEVAQF